MNVIVKGEKESVKKIVSDLEAGDVVTFKDADLFSFRDGDCIYISFSMRECNELFIVGEAFNHKNGSYIEVTRLPSTTHFLVQSNEEVNKVYHASLVLEEVKS